MSGGKIKEVILWSNLHDFKIICPKRGTGLVSSFSLSEFPWTFYLHLGLNPQARRFCNGASVAV